MTRLTITEDPGEEFTVRGHNMVTDKDNNEVVFYGDVTKVHVVPEQASFTIQVLTPDFVLEMDFADADKVLEALGLFETKKVLEVDFDEPTSVRIIPSSSEPTLREWEKLGIHSRLPPIFSKILPSQRFDRVEVYRTHQMATGRPPTQFRFLSPWFLPIRCHAGPRSGSHQRPTDFFPRSVLKKD